MMKKLLLVILLGLILAFLESCNFSEKWPKNIETVVIIEPINDNWLVLRPVEMTAAQGNYLLFGYKTNIENDVEYFWYKTTPDKPVDIVEELGEDAQKFPTHLAYLILDTLQNAVYDSIVRDTYFSGNILINAYLSPNKKFVLSSDMKQSRPKDDPFFTRLIATTTHEQIFYNKDLNKFETNRSTTSSERANPAPFIFLTIIAIRIWLLAFGKPKDANKRLGWLLFLLTMLMVAIGVIIDFHNAALIIDALILAFLIWIGYYIIGSVLNALNKRLEIPMPRASENQAPWIIACAIFSSLCITAEVDAPIRLIWVPFTIILLPNLVFWFYRILKWASLAIGKGVDRLIDMNRENGNKLD